jgi:hypothetical protein
MAFNYFDNKSILGKSIKQVAGRGISNLSSEQAGTINFISSSSPFTNNITGTSQVTTQGSVNISYVVSGIVILNWRLDTSSEGGYDFGQLLLNGIQLARISGNPASQSGIIQMLSGTNTLNLNYTKDDTVDTGSDNTTAFWSFT